MELGVDVLVGLGVASCPQVTHVVVPTPVWPDACVVNYGIRKAMLVLFIEQGCPYDRASADGQGSKEERENLSEHGGDEGAKGPEKPDSCSSRLYMYTNIVPQWKICGYTTPAVGKICQPEARLNTGRKKARTRSQCEASSADLGK